MSLKSINPANGEEIAAYKEMSTDEVDGILTSVNDAFNSWGKTSFSIRGELLKNAAAILQSNKEAFGRLMSLEMGKPYSQSLAEVVKCAKGCEYYADNTEEILADRIIETDASKSYVSHQPIGIVLAVMPWNFPFWKCFALQLQPSWRGM